MCLPIDKMKNMQKKNLTNSDLAKIMEVRFDDSDKQFAEIKLELYSIKAKIGDLEVQVDEKIADLSKMVKEDIGAFGEEVYNIKNRVGKLESKYLQLKAAK